MINTCARQILGISSCRAKIKARAWKCEPKGLAHGWARQEICCRIRKISQVFRFLGACLHKKCREATQNCSMPETFSSGGPFSVRCFQRADFNPSINSSLPHKHRETHFSVLNTVACCHFLNWKVMVTREGCGDSGGTNKKAKGKVSLWFQQKTSPRRCSWFAISNEVGYLHFKQGWATSPLAYTKVMSTPFKQTQKTIWIAAPIRRNTMPAQRRSCVVSC